MGSLAASIGVVQHEVDEARAAHDLVKLQCVQSKLGELLAQERHARDLRSAARMATIDGDDDASALNQLVSLEAQGRSLRQSASACVGAELAAGERTTTAAEGAVDRDGDGVPDQEDRMPDSPEDRDGFSDLANKQLDNRGANLMATSQAAGATGSSSGAPSSSVASASAASAKDAHDASMLIRTAEIALAVYEVDKNLGEVERSAKDLGGYLALRSDHEVTVRVPREHFDELVARVEKMGDVLHKNIAAEDVTDQYVDVEMRLKNAIAVRARLEKLLETAAVRDAVEIHRELAKVTEEIERYEGKLKLLRDRIAYSTVTVSFEKSQTQQVRSEALLPFTWMNTMGLSPLLKVPR